MLVLLHHFDRLAHYLDRHYSPAQEPNAALQLPLGHAVGHRDDAIGRRVRQLHAGHPGVHLDLSGVGALAEVAYLRLGLIVVHSLGEILQQRLGQAIHWATGGALSVPPPFARLSSRIAVA